MVFLTYQRPAPFISGFLTLSTPKNIGSFNCEFIDGFHGGDVTYAKILLALATQNKKLTVLLNLNYLSRIISLYHGLAFIPDKQVTLKKEIDFTQLGCKK